MAEAVKLNEAPLEFNATCGQNHRHVCQPGRRAKRIEGNGYGQSS